MKKAISLLLALVMCLSLCACGGGSDTPETTEAPTETLPSATETEPLEIDVAKPFDVFKLLFFVETAVVVVSAVIFTVIRFKKKRIKQ